MFCLFLNSAHTSAKRKLWRYFLRQTFYTDEGVIPETSDNFTLKFGTRDIHFLVLIISYEYHAAKTYFATYLRDLVLEILRFSWYFGRCSWFFGGVPAFLGSVPGFLGEFLVFWGCFGFSGGSSGFSGGVPGSLGSVPGFLGGCSGFSGGVPGFLGGVPGFRWCSGFFGCSGVPVFWKYYMPRVMVWTSGRSLPI